MTPLEFRTSSYSGSQGDCVEVADLPGEHLVRDTKNRAAGHLAFVGPEWAAFLSVAQNDQK
ncbi:hypothetical protein GCM10007079_40830 [Nocardiopsis terrae]|uniref:DUF397 domain-containing protein n=1 Tax=Nocardiopsis terrae TaxID=372655 RepID=A0ABR9HLZ9_9ACTN|nr:DUF397 domain-containing protein [Nocardiopsis terrae]MBE1460038.1 hypothetical protein [Nocardiopsis terrae]GHC92522.1 hypothetical protein GCM10007079_40830 [Nocardiopsis terrae]